MRGHKQEPTKKSKVILSGSVSVYAGVYVYGVCVWVHGRRRGVSLTRGPQLEKQNASHPAIFDFLFVSFSSSAFQERS